MSLRSSSFTLSQLSFSGSIDYIKIATPGKRELPPLFGRPAWGVAAHYKELTIHDLQPGDVPRLARVFPRAQVLALEVTVDARAARHVTNEEGPKLLDDLFVFVAHHLYPYDAPRLGNAKTAGYIPETGKLRPFARRVPKTNEELLFGFRDDQPVQVKVYRKDRDNGESLPPARHSVRIEVALKREMCAELCITKLEDLVDFRFRTALSAYFRMVRQPVAVKKRTDNPVLKLVEDRLAKLRQVEADQAWGTNGVQKSRLLPRLKHRRASDLNQKIGKALQHLQDRFGRKNLVRRELIRSLPAPVLARLSEACMVGRITTRRPSTLHTLFASGGPASATILV